MADSVANMLSQIKNAGLAGKDSVVVPNSKFLAAIAAVLLKEGYIASINRKGKGRQGQAGMEIGIAYEGGRSKISGIKRVSKLSRRFYVGARSLRPVQQGFGRLFLSTPKGIMTDKEAKKEHVGGEALFEIW